MRPWLAKIPEPRGEPDKEREDEPECQQGDEEESQQPAGLAGKMPNDLPESGRRGHGKSLAVAQTAHTRKTAPRTGPEGPLGGFNATIRKIQKSMAHVAQKPGEV